MVLLYCLTVAVIWVILWDWVIFGTSHSKFLPQFFAQAKTKGRKARAKMARILCHPLLMEREKVATRTARECEHRRGQLHERLQPP